jgi:tRNA nucleotidyltransferase (CCA-adding enzyme)
VARDYVRKENTGEPTTNPKHFGTVAKAPGRSVSSLRQDVGSPVEVHMPGLITLTPSAQAIVDRITEIGGHPYLVGGCVRDAIIAPGTTPKDIDIESFGLEMQELRYGVSKVVDTDQVGAQFSVMTARWNGEEFDISLPRKEVKTGEGHRDFDVVPDPYSTLEDASARRDYTINALMYDPATEIVTDCWGGLDDLKNGVLRHTSDAFSEDPLRVMRGVAFAARFGFDMDPETVGLCRSLVDKYDTIPKDRIWKAWKSMAGKGADLSNGLRILHETGWEKHYPQLGSSTTSSRTPPGTQKATCTSTRA